MAAIRRFTLDWRIKALAFRVFDTVPLGDRLYDLVQRKVTKTVPRTLAPTDFTARHFMEHVRVIVEYLDKPVGDIVSFEFGAGWDLYGNIVAWCLGLNHQTVYDLNTWLKPDQVNIVIRHLKVDPPPGALRVPTQVLTVNGDWRGELRAHYGITYAAPADAAKTGLPSASIDAIMTTSVFEHIPVDQIRPILVEGRRLLRPSGVMSHVIDYSDHYAHSDSSIGRYNFLRYGEAQWRLANPGIHFQNRLRHCQFEAIFAEARLSVVSETVHIPDDAAQELQSISLSDRFATFTKDQILPLTGKFILRPKL